MEAHDDEAGGKQTSALEALLYEERALRAVLEGLPDATVATGRWSVDGTELVIEFLPPQSGTVRLPFRRDGETLVISGAPFARVGG